MINFKNVSFAYDQHAVLDKFNLQFVDKKINCIVGPSAVGKTTLLNLIARTIAPTKGTINNVNRNVSYLFQDERLINEITVYKNLELVLKSVFHNENKRRSLIIKGLKSIGMEHTEN
jgi:NitT/TauT family transport system ATP-binding protein